MLVSLPRSLPEFKVIRSTIVSVRLPVATGKLLKRLAGRYGWSASVACARLVEEGLLRSDFAFIDFRDSSIGRQAYVECSTLAVWEVILLCRCYENDLTAVAKHLHWPVAKVQASRKVCRGFCEGDRPSTRRKSSCEFHVNVTRLAANRRIHRRRATEAPSPLIERL